MQITHSFSHFNYQMTGGLVYDHTQEDSEDEIIPEAIDSRMSIKAVEGQIRRSEIYAHR